MTETEENNDKSTQILINALIQEISGITKEIAELDRFRTRLRSRLQRLSRLAKKSQPAPEKVITPEPPHYTATGKNELLDFSISILALSPKTETSLTVHKICTLRELTLRSELDLLTIQDIGRSALREITRELSLAGFTLKKHEPTRKRILRTEQHVA